MTLHTAWGLWLLAIAAALARQQAECFAGSKVTPGMSPSPLFCPTDAPHHHVALAQPIRQQQAGARTRMNAHQWCPFSTSSKRDRGYNRTEAWHYMGLSAIAVSFPKNCLRRDTGRVTWQTHFIYYRARTAETTTRQAEEELFNPASTTTLIFIAGISLSSAEREVSDVAMFAAPNMRKVKEGGQLSTWEYLTNYQLNVTRNMLPKGQLWIAPSAGLSTCSCQTWAPGRPEILKQGQFHCHYKNLNLQTYFKKSAPSKLQKNEQSKVPPRVLTDLQYYFQFTFFCSVSHIFLKLTPLLHNTKQRAAGKEEIRPENSKYFI